MVLVSSFLPVFKRDSSSLNLKFKSQLDSLLSYKGQSFTTFTPTNTTIIIYTAERVTLDWGSVLSKRGQITAGELQHEHKIASTSHTNASDKPVYEGSLLQDTHGSSWQPQPLSSAKTVPGMALGNYLAPDQIWQAWKCCFISLPQKKCFF